MASLILPHAGKTPKLEVPLYIAPNASIIGDVEAGPECSFWFSTVVRADVNEIRIGAGTNIQDLSMLHVSYKRAGLYLGDDVTVGHGCILHACTVGNRVLVGMGTIIMDLANIGDDVLIGAGSLITESTKVPSGTLVLGRPAKVIRELTKDELAFVARSAPHYRHVARSYSGGPWPYPGKLHQ